MALDLLPNSFAQVIRGLKWSAVWGCMTRPIFCANCGRPGPYVPEDNCDFACYLCNDCFRDHPLPMGLYGTPDEVFLAKVAADHAPPLPLLNQD